MSKTKSPTTSTTNPAINWAWLWGDNSTKDESIGVSCQGVEARVTLSMIASQSPSDEGAVVVRMKSPSD